MRIILIAAIDKNNAIGFENDLLWKNKEDMKHFKNCTEGHSVLMGKNTWNSLPEKFRPLPKRKNIIFSKTCAEYYNQVEGASQLLPNGQRAFECISQLSEIKKLNCPSGKLFVIGGAQLYKSTIDIADELIITHINENFEKVDTYFPKINSCLWKLDFSKSSDEKSVCLFNHYVKRNLY
jgi:dihydrofolate reductase